MSYNQRLDNQSSGLHTFLVNFKHTVDNSHVIMRNTSLTCALIYHAKLELAITYWTMFSSSNIIIIPRFVSMFYSHIPGTCWGKATIVIHMSPAGSACDQHEWKDSFTRLSASEELRFVELIVKIIKIQTLKWKWWSKTNEV